MKEISLHILDIIQNSIVALAGFIRLIITEDTVTDRMEIVVEDNGKGIPADMLAKVTDPFVTSRTTRKVGMGLSLWQSGARGCEGDLEVTSEVGKGTVIRVWYRHSHIDRPPLGDMLETMLALVIMNPTLDFYYQHQVDKRDFVFDTREIREALGGADADLTDPLVYEWMKGALQESLELVYGGIEP